MTDDLITIASDRLVAAINPFGAELTHLRDAQGRELMTDADPAFWARHAPLLFPVIGVVNGGTIKLAGKEYPMPKHGFARDMAFEVIAHEDQSATFRLRADDDTMDHYPFDFVLDVTFTISGATLSIEAAIGNRGDRAMPAQFGFHPAFAWPLPFGQARTDHRITFDKPEPDPLRVIADDGTIAPGHAPSPLDGRVLHLADDLFEHDALVWDHVRSDHVVFGGPTGSRLRIDFPDTPMLGIWTRPGAKFVCVEPWHGIADPQGYNGSFRDKPGVFEVAPGDTKRVGMAVTLLDR